MFSLYMQDELVRWVRKPWKGIAASKHGQYFELRGGSACPKLKGGDPWHKKYGNEYSWIWSNQNQELLKI